MRNKDRKLDQKSGDNLSNLRLGRSLPRRTNVKRYRGRTTERGQVITGREANNLIIECLLSRLKKKN